MTNKILIRTDDLGYSKAVNYGIYESIHNGLIKNVGFMVNMDASEHGLNLIKDEDVAIGLHTVICVGKPLLDPKLIPSIVQDNGEFKKSKTYRMADSDFVKFDEVILEIEAQYQKFVELVGRSPDYFEGHAVSSDNFNKGLEYVANKHNVPFLSCSPDSNDDVKFKNSLLRPIMKCMEDNYNPKELIKKAADFAKCSDIIPMIIFHCGYLDEYILNSSSLTFPRVKEVEASTDKRLKEWIDIQNIELTDYKKL